MSIKDNVAWAFDQIEKTKVRCGIKHAVELIAVTKTQPLLRVLEACEHGVVHIGENKIQEAVQKFKEEKRNSITKRFIGHLQTNKINKCLDLFDTIDSVDSVRLAKKISKKMVQREKSIPIFLEVNTSGDKEKNGFKPEELEEMLEVASLGGLEVNGLMTIGPRSQNRDETRRAFKKLYSIKENLNQQSPKSNIYEVSMGMSGDFEIGIEEGSTMVRIGTAIFGERGSL